MKYLRAAFYSILWVLFPLGAAEPIAIYLTWTQDPTSTMVVQWQALTGSMVPQLDYHAAGESSWKPAKGQSLAIEDCEVHLVNLEGLREDSEYVFKVQGSKREYRFQTMPKKLSRPIRMVIGGDAYYTIASEVFHRMNRMIAFNKPDFVVIGGDLAYTTGTKHLLKGPQWAFARWQAFLRDLQKSLGQEGKLIPILPIIGNHDVHKTKNENGMLEMFYQIFTFPEANKAYRSLDFGDYLSLVMLDTGHTWPIEGDQTAWLEKTLRERKSVPYLLTAYHIAAYPSFYPFTGNIEERIRKNWVPLFEKYQVPFAFEHHNHTLKRTHPLKEGIVNPSGVTYLGDGSWGTPVREVKSPEKLWYLAKSASVNSCYIVTLTEEKCLIEAKNIQGEVIDRIERINALTTSPIPVSSER
jgi:hypothetical protein